MDNNIIAIFAIAGLAATPLLIGDEWLTPILIAIGSIVLINQSGGKLALGKFDLVA